MCCRRPGGTWRTVRPRFCFQTSSADRRREEYHVRRGSLLHDAAFWLPCGGAAMHARRYPCGHAEHVLGDEAETTAEEEASPFTAISRRGGGHLVRRARLVCAGASPFGARPGRGCSIGGPTSRWRRISDPTRGRLHHIVCSMTGNARSCPWGRPAAHARWHSNSSPQHCHGKKRQEAHPLPRAALRRTRVAIDTSQVLVQHVCGEKVTRRRSSLRVHHAGGGRMAGEAILRTRSDAVLTDRARTTASTTQKDR